jgi:hypothetical protein
MLHTTVRRVQDAVTSQPALAAALLLAATFVLAATFTLARAGDASAKAFLPPGNKIFAGVAFKPVSTYTAAVHKHPAVFEEFLAWGQYLPGIAQAGLDEHARLEIHITTGYGPREAITPAGIANGKGDAWLIGLNNALYETGNITYVRLMAEMNNANNPYSAYDAAGRSRGPSHSTAAYKKAWKRVTLIMRGGRLKNINATLKRLKMPRLHSSGDLPRPKVAMLWVPQSAGTPNIPAQAPAAYYPGRPWVDWVGTDFYSKFPNFTGLTQLYNHYGGFPFTFGEYAFWDSGDPGFMDRLFAWIATHQRTRMLVYYQGAEVNGPFRLSHYPAGARELRRLLASAKFPAFAPEWAGGSRPPQPTGPGSEPFPRR